MVPEIKILSLPAAGLKIMHLNLRQLTNNFAPARCAAGGSNKISGVLMRIRLIKLLPVLYFWRLC